MKKLKIVILTVIVSLIGINVSAQNVGVGQTNPTNTLHITPITANTDPIRIDGLQAFSVADTAIMVVNPTTGVVRYINASSLGSIIGNTSIDTADIISIIYNYGDTLLSNPIFITNLGDSLLNNNTFLTNLADSIDTDIDSLVLSGTTLTAYENTSSASVDLANLPFDTTGIISIIYNYGDTLLSNPIFITNLGDSLLNNNTFLTNLADSIDTDIDSLVLSGTILTAYENGNGVTVDLASLTAGGYVAGIGISIVGTTINNTGDLSNSNEYNTAFQINAGNLEITDGGGTLSVPLSAIQSAIETLTSISFVPATGILTYNDEAGTATNINLSTMIANFETLTSISQNNAAGTITYVDENGASTVLNIAALIAANETLTSVSFVPATGILTYNDEAGTATNINLSTMIANFETLTSISQNNAAGT
ncbi:MAG: hypothetical protein JKY30_00060, partial [Flavobacteriales bacterium]|nr:hypothetical protein [Flavobacteriales bacterium]